MTMRKIILISALALLSTTARAETTVCAGGMSQQMAGMHRMISVSDLGHKQTCIFDVTGLAPEPILPCYIGGFCRVTVIGDRAGDSGAVFVTKLLLAEPR
jgi:hypothetical protein